MDKPRQPTQSWLTNDAGRREISAMASTEPTTTTPIDAPIPPPESPQTDENTQTTPEPTTSTSLISGSNNMFNEAQNPFENEPLTPSKRDSKASEFENQGAREQGNWFETPSQDVSVRTSKATENMSEEEKKDLEVMTGSLVDDASIARGFLERGVDHEMDVIDAGPMAAVATASMMPEGKRWAKMVDSGETFEVGIGEVRMTSSSASPALETTIPTLLVPDAAALDDTRERRRLHVPRIEDLTRTKTTPTPSEIYKTKSEELSLKRVHAWPPPTPGPESLWHRTKLRVKGAPKKIRKVMAGKIKWDKGIGHGKVIVPIVNIEDETEHKTEERRISKSRPRLNTSSQERRRGRSPTLRPNATNANHTSIPQEEIQERQRLLDEFSEILGLKDVLGPAEHEGIMRKAFGNPDEILSNPGYTVPEHLMARAEEALASRFDGAGVVEEQTERLASNQTAATNQPNTSQKSQPNCPTSRPSSEIPGESLKNKSTEMTPAQIESRPRCRSKETVRYRPATPLDDKPKLWHKENQGTGKRRPKDRGTWNAKWRGF